MILVDCVKEIITCSPQNYLKTMPEASADDDDGFQTQFTHIMETILQTAVREATKLYDGTLQRLKAELVQLRQEKVNTKTGDASSQNTKRFSEAGRERTGNVSKHRDIGVQCGMSFSYNSVFLGYGVH